MSVTGQLVLRMDRSQQKKICEEMDTEAVLKEKRLRSTSSLWSIVSLEDHIQSLEEIRNNFGVLLSCSQLDAQTQRDQCKLLEDKLTCGEEAHVDGSALA